MNVAPARCRWLRLPFRAFCENWGPLSSTTPRAVATSFVHPAVRVVNQSRRRSKTGSDSSRHAPQWTRHFCQTTPRRPQNNSSRLTFAQRSTRSQPSVNPPPRFHALMARSENGKFTSDQSPSQASVSHQAMAGASVRFLGRRPEQDRPPSAWFGLFQAPREYFLKSFTARIPAQAIRPPVRCPSHPTFVNFVPSC